MNCAKCRSEMREYYRPPRPTYGEQTILVRMRCVGCGWMSNVVEPCAGERAMMRAVLETSQQEPQQNPVPEVGEVWAVTPERACSVGIESPHLDRLTVHGFDGDTVLLLDHTFDEDPDAPWADRRGDMADPTKWRKVRDAPDTCAHCGKTGESHTWCKRYKPRVWTRDERRRHLSADGARWVRAVMRVTITTHDVSVGRAGRMEATIRYEASDAPLRTKRVEQLFLRSDAKYSPCPTDYAERWEQPEKPSVESRSMDALFGKRPLPNPPESNADKRVPGEFCEVVFATGTCPPTSSEIRVGVHGLTRELVVTSCEQWSRLIEEEPALSAWTEGVTNMLMARPRPLRLIPYRDNVEFEVVM